MGKGQIIEEQGDGRYSVKLLYDGRSEVEAQIVSLNQKKTDLQTQYDSMPETTEQEIFDKNIVGLQIKSVQKKIDYLTDNFPDDLTVNIWCADLTTGLTGNVGIIEIPGEYVGKANIKPGYSDQAIFNKSVDGQLRPSIAMGPWSNFLDRCILPGWQKFKPLHRYGKIVADSINFESDTCSVCIDPTYSSQRSLNVNLDEGFSECSEDPPEGFTQFCTDNPTHPT